MTDEEATKIFENEIFISLLAAAQEDSGLRQRLLVLLRSDDIARVSELKDWLKYCSEKQAPKAFMDALSYLVHAKVAAKALDALV